MGSPCSYWAYIDAGSEAATVSIESTCPLYGEPVARVTGRWLIQPRGASLSLEYRVPSGSVVSAAETPCTPRLLPQPWPPYQVADATIVVDSEPGLELYGLPWRRSNVVTLTRRTLLEGQGIVQLVAVRGEEALDWQRASVRGWLSLATLPPLEAAEEELREPRRCAQRAAGGLAAWGRCLWEHGRGCPSKLLEETPRGAWSRACLYARLYAGALAEAGVEPLDWLLRVRGEDGEGAWAPARLLGSGMLEVLAPAVRAVLWRREGSSVVTREATFEKGVHVLKGWERVGLACRRCLRGLDSGAG
jgi:hypothetical protein